VIRGLDASAAWRDREWKKRKPVGPNSLTGITGKRYTSMSVATDKEVI